MEDTLGAVTGQVVDLQSGKGVSAAEITLAPLDRTTSSGPDGDFTFRDVPAGGYDLTVEHAGYVGYTTDVVVEAGRVSNLRMHISAAPVSLDPLEVRVRREYLESVGYYERMEKGIGRYFTPERLERLGIRNFGRFRPDILLSSTAFAGNWAQQLKGCLDFVYFLDGRHQPRGITRSRVKNLSADEVAAVEGYPYGHGLPGFAMDKGPRGKTANDGGAVAVWTKRWESDEAGTGGR